MKLGSHVGMSGTTQFLGSAQEAFSYGANTLMIYTGAPQNTRRKDLSELRIEEGKKFMSDHGISDLIVHAPYIINLGNSVKSETYKLAVEFLALELERTAAFGSNTLVLHPGAHVGAGEDKGIAQIIKGINEVLTKDTKVNIALEAMAGKGTEIGNKFEDLKRIYDGVIYSDKIKICFDTCHVHDAGYDIVQDFDGILGQFDREVGIDKIAVFHINDSKNPCGAGKDRHENIGFGYIGFTTLYNIINHEKFMDIPKILETPYVPSIIKPKKTYPPYEHEIHMLKCGLFDPKLKDIIIRDYEEPSRYGNCNV